MKQAYLLTGRPGTGKTSIIKQVATQMQVRAGGFYTEEIRSRGVREGFRLVSLNGEDTILAHVNIHSPYRVSKYGVDIEALEHVGVPAIYNAVQQCDLIIVDEIGKMELFSVKFREAISQIIDSGKRVLGTIMLNSNPWADAIKRHPEVNLVIVTRENNQQLLDDIQNWLKNIVSL
jgi:nucleoside-triphosphatase